MAVRDITIAAATDDAYSFHNHSGFSTSSSGWLPIQQHVNSTLATVTGWRFQVPSDIDPNTITNVQLRLTSNTSGSPAFTAPVDIRIEKSAVAFGNTDPGRPSNRHADAITSGATLVNWTMPTTVSNSGLVANSPDISVPIVNAMTDVGYTPGTTYIGILAKAPIGGPVSIQTFCQEYTTATFRPTLRITYTAPETWDAISASNISYHDSVGLSSNRICDISVPAGEPDNAAGRPAVVYLHGGFWRTGQGSRSSFPTGLRSHLNDHGIITINASYKLVQSDILISNTNASYPDPVHDMVSMMNWISNPENAEFYRIDPSKVFFVGTSAGGHVALSAALGIKDVNNYTGYQNTSYNRSSGSSGLNYGNTRPVFNLDRGGAATTQMPKGVFLIATPIDLGAASGHSNPGINAAINLGRTGYMGQNQGVNPNTTVHDELDLNKYIKGTSTVYGSTPKKPAVPIGYAYAENDEIILQNYGINSLKDALTVHPDYEVKPVGELSRTGLSYFEIPGATHDNAHTDSDVRPLISNWIEHVLSQPVEWKPQAIYY